MARQPLKIEGATASVKAPASVKAGAEFQVSCGLAAGAAVTAPAGNYTVRIKGRPDTKTPVGIKSKETATVTL